MDDEVQVIDILTAFLTHEAPAQTIEIKILLGILGIYTVEWWNSLFSSSDIVIVLLFVHPPNPAHEISPLPEKELDYCVKSSYF